jgi:hypothetical protein
VSRGRSALVGLVLLAGCGPSYPEQAGQERALPIVWTAAFQADAQPPAIEWREDDCGGPLPGVREDGACYAGLYLRGDHALVAWRGSFHASAYAHEMMHALQWGHGVEDPQHTRPEWSLVDRANAALRAAGL